MAVLLFNPQKNFAPILRPHNSFGGRGMNKLLSIFQYINFKYDLICKHCLKQIYCKQFTLFLWFLGIEEVWWHTHRFEFFKLTFFKSWHIIWKYFKPLHLLFYMYLCEVFLKLAIENVDWECFFLPKKSRRGKTA